MRCLIDERCHVGRWSLVLKLLGYSASQMSGPQLSYRCPWGGNQPSIRNKDQDYVLLVRRTGAVPVSAITDDSGIGLLGGRKTPYWRENVVYGSTTGRFVVDHPRIETRHNALGINSSSYHNCMHVYLRYTLLLAFLGSCE